MDRKSPSASPPPQQCSCGVLLCFRGLKLSVIPVQHNFGVDGLLLTGNNTLRIKDVVWNIKLVTWNKPKTGNTHADDLFC